MSSGRRVLAGEMAVAATTWLESLDERQLTLARGPVPSHDGTDDDRRRWFYTPTDHGGLTIHDQSPTQQRNTMRLVASGLSDEGFVTVATCMGRENILDRSEGFSRLFARERARDPGMYYLRVFGEPGGDAPWGWRFGGHHVSLHNLVVDGELVATTPCFLGMNPHGAPLLGGAVSRPLAMVEDLARDLVRSLPDALRERAVVLDRAVPDLVSSNRTHVAPGDRYRSLKDPDLWRDVPFPDEQEQAGLVRASDALDEGFTEEHDLAVAHPPEPAGAAAAEMDADQRGTLRALLATYTDRVPAAARRAWEDDELDEVHIQWAGPLEEGAGSWYRIMGPRLLVEWDNTQNDANHCHSVWRDPENDFGLGDC